MSNILLIEQIPFLLIDDDSFDHDSIPYQKVREQINKRVGLFGESVDWTVVQNECESLGSGNGLNLLMCCYYAVACLKIRGLHGYTNALELVLLAVSKGAQVDPKIAKNRKDALDWMNTRVVREICDLKPDHNALRDLYRCENYFERLNLLIEYSQPDHLVDFESVAFAIFEHLDRIETRTDALLRQSDELFSVKLKKRQKRSHLWMLGFFTLGIFLALTGEWLYRENPWDSRSSYSQFIIEPRLFSEQQAQDYLAQYSQHERQENELAITTLYKSSISRQLLSSVGESFKRAENELLSLKILYPDSELSKASAAEFEKKKRDALVLTSQFVDRFKDIRTRMANISLLARKGQWLEVRKQAKALEDFAISLSPVYGRVEYVQQLLGKGELDEASHELEILTLRLNSLSWILIELENQVAEMRQDQKARESLPAE